MDLKKLEKVLLNEPKFRLVQAKKLIFIDLIDDWDKASVFPLNLRDKLNKEFSLNIKGDIFLSKDEKSMKAVIYLDDGNKIEASLMIHQDGRNTACLSSQIGCPLACKFCASGTTFKRNLRSDEIIMQALFLARYLKIKELGSLTNIVFMGSGEPFLNYESVFESINILHDPNFFNISSRKISISTVGITQGIRKMINEKHKVNLAISLHFCNDKLRARMMPISKKYPLNKVLEAVDYYIERTNRKVMFEYMLIKDLNDFSKDAENLANLMKRPLVMVNLIKHNKVGEFEPSETKAIDNFKKILGKKGIEVIERHRFNEDVFGACGQLSSK